MPGFVKKSAAEFGEKIGYEISYQDLTISPLALKIEFAGLRLAKSKGSELIAFQSLLLNLKWSKLVLGELGFDEILLDKPQVLVERTITKEGRAETWNWQEFMAAIEKSFKSPDRNEPKKPLKISIDELIVRSASLKLLDQSKQLREELRPFSMRFLDVANYDQNGVVNGVRGHYDFKLGALELTVPGLNRMISYGHVAITGGLDNQRSDELGIQLNLQLDDGEILSHWSLNTKTKSLDGEVEIKNLATAPIIPLLPANKELLGISGRLGAKLAIKIAAEADTVSGDLLISDLAILEKGQKVPLLVWKTADIHALEYKSFKTNQANNKSLTIDTLAIHESTLQFEINEEGFSNFRRLFSQSNTSSSKSELEFSNQSKFNLDIRTVSLKGGEVFFSDLAMRSHLKVDVKKFNATLLDVSNTPGRFATVAMDGVVAGSGSMRAKGRTSFDDPRRNHDILMTFRNLPLSAFNPAVMTFAGYQIASGRLNLNLNYRAKDGELSGSNQIIIKKVVLGDEVPDFTGKKLPLGLAIALLEDSDDTIDISVNIAGNVDSPKFSASGLVWQAISNVLSNITTAPFRALASLIGIGGEEGVNALPGEAVFLTVDQERLEKFGEYLLKRPNSSLEIIGTYDPAQDRKELARAKADSAILMDAGFKLIPGEPIPVPSLSDPKVQSGLKSAYAQYVGRIKLGQRLLTLPDGEQRNQQLHDELIAGMEVSDAELKELANARARVAYGLMTKSDSSLKDRIQLGGVKTVEAGKEGIPLEVEVRIK